VKRKSNNRVVSRGYYRVGQRKLSIFASLQIRQFSSDQAENLNAFKLVSEAYVFQFST
jgi:hypothetical protein